MNLPALLLSLAFLPGPAPRPTALQEEQQKVDERPEVKALLDEIDPLLKAKGEKDPEYRLKILESKVNIQVQKSTSGPRYTPVSRRQDRPNAILWLVRNHPELKDSAIMRLVGTTKSTISAIRDRTHWNAAALAPMDPVTLGLCSQIDLDFEVSRANKEKPLPAASGATLLPASETTARKDAEVAAAAEEKQKSGGDLDVSAVFAKLKQLGGKGEQEENE